ncbi:universal stress protein [Nocardioides sp.]|uniref:universal stress protein n=1 Tax=Nocardioides sp. TaxID=35761 RepID=UPI00356780E5
MMIKSTSIVVGADGSAHSERALEWAADQALLEGRPLTVVAVGDDAPEISDRAAAMARATRPDLPVEAVATTGDPRSVLLDLSREAYLIVIGSRGRGSIKSMLLGSVSAAVSSHAECPVVVCRPATAEPPTDGIVVGADGTPESVPIIEFAYRQAAIRGLHLTVLHSFWDAAVAVAQYREATGRPVEEPDLEDLRAVVSTSVAGLAATYPDVKVTFALKHGFADQALSERGSRWDMIVVGRHPKETFTGLLAGSISTAVVERAHTTVVVVPEARASN